MPRGWRDKQLAKLRRRRNPRRLTKATFLHHLPGTMGNIKELAKRLNCTRTWLYELLRRPDWEDIKQALAEEEKSADFMAESELYTLMQELDPAIRLSAVKFYLQSRMPEKYARKNPTVPGGVNIGSVTMVNNIPVEALDLPLEVQRAILAAADRKAHADAVRVDSAVVKQLPSPLSKFVEEDDDE